MARFTPLDERFAHQIPEPFPAVQTFHRDWRESLFFILHSPHEPDDVVILTLAHYPARGEMDSLQMGRVGANPVFALHHRPVKDDQDDFRVGPVAIDIEKPLKRIRLRVAGSESAPVALDLTFTARTRPHQLRRGTMKAGHELIWDQSHMIQSGSYDGFYTHNGVRREIAGWVGQRDHSWGVRVHNRVPMWMWLAIQLPEGMLGVWHWEYADGAVVYTDGCFAPADGGEPVPVVGFRHDLAWQDVEGKPVSYERFGERVQGLAGDVAFTLRGGRVVTVSARGRWAQRYSNPAAPYPGPGHGMAAPLGGGLCEMTVETGDGSRGTAIYEITGQWHHRYFPLPRG